jgi:hypothetical protein
LEYGNNPGEAHKVSLLKLLNAYTRMAQGELAGRWAFPLPTGAGKTLSIVAWIASLYELGIEHISSAVCANKVEALCDLKRALIEWGVPEEKVGLLHSYSFNPETSRKFLEEGEPLPVGYASLPSTQDNEQKQFLLCTHERVRGKSGTEQYNLFQGRARDLLIWDESLFISDTSSIEATLLRQAIGHLGPAIEERKISQDLRDCFDYLQSAIEMLYQEIKSQKDEGNSAQRIELPKLSSQQLQNYKQSLPESEVYEPLKYLLDMSQNPLRVALTEQKNGVITYDIVVPSELENIIILDASYPIRELQRLDKTIEPYPDVRVPVSYERVTVYQMDQPSGRHTMEKSFRQSRKNRIISKETGQVVKGVPEGGGILVLTFKNRRVDFQDILRRDFRAMGIDTDAKIKVPVWKDGEQVFEEKPRINFLTWGNETSLSRYSFCSNVIFVGVLHLPHVELAAKIAGQRDELMSPLPKKTIKDIEQSECAYSTHQAMCRGSCRIIEANKTKPMNVWLIHPGKQIRTALAEVMPGVRWKTWETALTKPEGKTQQITAKISKYLKQLGSGVHQIPTRKVKDDLDLSEIPISTFTQAAKKVLPEETGFQHKGRSFERVHREAA